MRILSNTILIFLLTSCANMVAPIGGVKDLDAPKLLNIAIIEHQKNTHSKTISFEFNEYIQLNKWQEYFYISPPTKTRIQKKIKRKTLYVTFEDSLNENATYCIALNSCIKDNNEGNVLDSLIYMFSKNDSFDTLTLSGDLQDAYTLKHLENVWVMLFNMDINDSLIFKETPNYIAKTDKNGAFHFYNLKDKNYKIVALTGSDFIYNNEEKMAFSDNILNAKTDSFISLFAFDPTIEIDSIIRDSIELRSDSIIYSSLLQDSIEKKEELSSGKLEIITNKSSPCIFQLFQNGEVINKFHFAHTPYIINKIVPGKYNLKYIADNNQDSIWNTGNWEMRIQPEKAVNYYSEITIRSNWDLDLEWIIGE